MVVRRGVVESVLWPTPISTRWSSVAEFRSALRRFLGQTEKVARDSGLTPQRYLLLLKIKGARDRSQRASVSELASRLQLAQSTVTELVERAVQVGLLKREPDEQDHRVVWLRLTAEGERRLRKCLTGLEAERRRLGEAIDLPAASKV